MPQPASTTGRSRDFRSKATGRGPRQAALSSSGTICTNDTSTFATGSKDTLDIPAWQCNLDNNVNSKIDIMNAYAAQYIHPDGDQIMYFGLDKNKDNGNNNVAFWFLQSDASLSRTAARHLHRRTPTATSSSCLPSPTAAASATSTPTAGTARTIASTARTIRPDGPDRSGATARPHRRRHLRHDQLGPDEENDAITTQWLTFDATLGVGHTVVTTDFFEGGINLTEVFEGGRSALVLQHLHRGHALGASLTATLFDFARSARWLLEHAHDIGRRHGER